MYTDIMKRDRLRYIGEVMGTRERIVQVRLDPLMDRDALKRLGEDQLEVRFRFNDGPFDPASYGQRKVLEVIVHDSIAHLRFEGAHGDLPNRGQNPLLVYMHDPKVR